jgi:hypothetical protein
MGSYTNYSPDEAVIHAIRKTEWQVSEVQPEVLFGWRAKIRGISAFPRLGRDALKRNIELNYGNREGVIWYYDALARAFRSQASSNGDAGFRRLSDELARTVQLLDSGP